MRPACAGLVFHGALVVALVAGCAPARPSSAPAQQPSAPAQAPATAHRAARDAVLYADSVFVVTDTSVRQGRFEAIALSRDTIVSTYPRAAREVHFKFSMNSQENEFPPGTDHTLYIRPRGGRIVTPLYTFGAELPPSTPRPEDSQGSEEGAAQVTFRLDLRHVLRSFAERGAYDPPAGPPISAAEFQGVYVIGNTPPLTWDYRSLRPGNPLQLTDPDGDSVYTVSLPFEAAYTRPADAQGRGIWARELDVSRFPQLESPQRLADALYRMSLEELQQLVRDDGALSAGAKWPGVWTRDVSYAAVLALAIVAPDAVRRSLLAKVDSAGRIIQDSGTGGSWPVSTDRMTWALAAWELYAVTGNRAWLRQAYDIIVRSAEADLRTAFDERAGLFRGESSFLDWREQSHPRWMEPRDIFRSQALGTNAVHHATYRILGDMARALGEDASRWDRVAARVREGMNAHLWLADRGWYGQFRSGRAHLTLSPRAEPLGEALAVLYGAAPPERARELARRSPVVPFGVPSFWPYIPGRPAYHNAAFWPFVGAFWTWAAAEAGNTAAVEHGIATIWRAAALFLTNKENMVAATGHFEGTELNSDRQLWSVAANLATSYRVLFGMRLHPDRLAFEPMVPPSWAACVDGACEERTLRGLRYRDAVLTVTVRGHGAGIARVRLDGRPVERAEVPATLGGAHRLEIDLDGRWPTGEIHVVANRATPATPAAVLRGDTLIWRAVAGTRRYAVHRDGRPFAATGDTLMVIRPAADGLREWQVLAVDRAGLQSFPSEPVRVAPPGATIIVPVGGVPLETRHAGYTGAGYARLTTDRNTSLRLTVQVPTAGHYAIDVRYANGNGPVNSGDKAAVRSLLVDGERMGALVMPQRGNGAWDDWGYGSLLIVPLTAGSHVLTLALTPSDANMNGAVNEALVDHVRLTRLAEPPAP